MSATESDSTSDKVKTSIPLIGVCGREIHETFESEDDGDNLKLATIFESCCHLRSKTTMPITIKKGF